jgi:hypothetical protein
MTFADLRTGDLVFLDAITLIYHSSLILFSVNRVLIYSNASS